MDEAVHVCLLRGRHEPCAGPARLPAHDLDADQPAEADVAQDRVETAAQLVRQRGQGCAPSQACQNSGLTQALKRLARRLLKAEPV